MTGFNVYFIFVVPVKRTTCESGYMGGDDTIEIEFDSFDEALKFKTKYENHISGVVGDEIIDLWIRNHNYPDIIQFHPTGQIYKVRKELVV